MKFTLGADPELFLADAAGALVSSIGLIGGSKQDPRPLELVGPGFAVQEDNVAMEFNIPPAASADEFQANIFKVMTYLRAEVRGKYSLDVINLSAASFPVQQLRDPKAREFGCDPDFNAWRAGKRNPRPKAQDKNLRSCGGHLHVGYEFASREQMLRFIKFCDLFLGVPSVVMDKGELRKQLYGKAGCFRPKPYGCEYRSLSNFWVFDGELTKWAHRQVDRALDWTITGAMDIDDYKDQVLHAINDNDKGTAFNLVGEFNMEVMGV